MSETMVCITAIREACLRAASLATAYRPEEYSGGLDQHCGAVAYTVQQLRGGFIWQCRIDDVRHFFNQDSRGFDWDLSSDQFGGDGFMPLPLNRMTNFRPMPSRTTVNKKHREFYARVLVQLARLITWP